MLARLRSTVFLAWLTLTVMPWALVVVLLSPLVSRQRLYRICRAWLALATHSARLLCGVRWRVQGMAHVPTAADRRAGVVLAAKHQSTWETFAFPAIMPHPLAYVFKRELLWIPFFGWAIGSLDMIHIDRSRRTEAWAKVLAQGRRIMGEGGWVIMFPEGTRTERGKAGAYQSGAARLAIDTSMPIVPIAVTSARCWAPRSFLLRPGLIEVSIGPAIPSEGRRAGELTREVQAWIEAEMHRLDPEAYAGGAAS